MTDHDVIVVGSGPIGLSVAFELADRGVDVGVVEAASVGSGAARWNAGWVTPVMAAPVPAPGVVGKAVRWMFEPTSPLRVAPDLDPGHVAFMVGMLRASTRRRFAAGLAAVTGLARGTLDAFDRYADRGVLFELHRRGVLMAFLSEHEAAEHIDEYAGASAAGLVPPVVLSGAEVARLEPALSDRVVAGIWCPDQYHLDPSSYVDALAAALSARGVEVVAGSHVRALSVTGGAVRVDTEAGVLHAGQVVVAAGAASGPLTTSAGFGVPIRFGKGYGFDLPGQYGPSHAVYLAEAKVAVTPLDRGLRLAGTMEFGGDPRRVDLRRAGGILAAAGTYLRTPPAGAGRPWTGLRPMTSDGLPVIGRLPGAERVVLATGHAMLGVTLAPRTGALVAELVADDRLDPVLAPFSPSRFGHRRRRNAQPRPGG